MNGPCLDKIMNSLPALIFQVNQFRFYKCSTEKKVHPNLAGF